MKAALLLELGEPLEIEDVELLAPGPHDAIVRPGATAVCITDVLAAQGHVMAQPPTLLGHAAAGVVEEVGSGVTRVRPGDRVVGCGHLGLWMIQGGRLAGAHPIIAVEPRASRRTLAGCMGATHLVDPADGDPVAQVQALTQGRGADYVFEAAGPPEAMQQAFAMTRHAGTFVPTGWSTLSATVTFNAVEFAIGARRILGCQYGGATIRRDVPRFANLMQAGLVDPAPIVDRRFTLDEINDAFAAAEAREVLTGVVVTG